MEGRSGQWAGEEAVGPVETRGVDGGSRVRGGSVEDEGRQHGQGHQPTTVHYFYY